MNKSFFMWFAAFFLVAGCSSAEQKPVNTIKRAEQLLAVAEKEERGYYAFKVEGGKALLYANSGPQSNTSYFINYVEQYDKEGTTYIIVNEGSSGGMAGDAITSPTLVIEVKAQEKIVVKNKEGETFPELPLDEDQLAKEYKRKTIFLYEKDPFVVELKKTSKDLKGLELNFFETNKDAFLDDFEKDNNSYYRISFNKTKGLPTVQDFEDIQNILPTTDREISSINIFHGKSRADGVTTLWEYERGKFKKCFSSDDYFCEANQFKFNY